MDTVLWEERDGVALITLNRPEVRNAIDPDTSASVAALMRRFDQMPELRVAVLTGAPPVFCAGADIRALANDEVESIIGIDGGFCGIVRAERRKPLIAAVNGAALAGGCELALACDIVVAGEDAVFALPEVTLGIAAAAGGLVTLPEAIGSKRAAEYVLTGTRFSAREAASLGMVNHCVPEEEVVDRALSIAAQIAANGPRAVAESLAVMKVAARESIQEGWVRNEEAAERVFGSGEAAEGLAAYLEKRNPKWEEV